MTEAKCDRPGPRSWAVSLSVSLLQWTARPSAQRTEAAGRVIVSASAKWLAGGPGAGMRMRMSGQRAADRHDKEKELTLRLGKSFFFSPLAAGLLVQPGNHPRTPARTFGGVVPLVRLLHRPR
jgi:hypothetical protein